MRFGNALLGTGVLLGVAVGGLVAVLVGVEVGGGVFVGKAVDVPVAVYVGSSVGTAVAVEMAGASSAMVCIAAGLSLPGTPCGAFTGDGGLLFSWGRAA